MSVSPARLSSPSEAAAVALALGGFAARPSKYTPKKYLRNSPLFASLASSSASAPKKATPKRKRDSPSELDSLSLSSAEAPLSPTLSASSGDADSSVTLSDLEAAEFLVTFKRQCGSPTHSAHSAASDEPSFGARAKASSPLEWSLDARPSLSPSASGFAVPDQYSSARGQLLRFQRLASSMYQRKLDLLLAPAVSPASPADSDLASTDSIAEGL